MRELHLFAGAGGGILGGILLGHTCVCAVEIDSYCRRVLLQRQRDGLLPRFPIWDDIRTFDGRPWHGLVDCVCGGFPCQDISIAGRGRGINGSRSGLWNEMARIVSEVRPRYVFVENSPMLIQRGLAVVLTDLAEMGFDARWGIVSAADAGFPHIRRRIWIYAYPHQDNGVRQRMPYGSRNASWRKPPENGKEWRDRFSPLAALDDLPQEATYTEKRRMLHGVADGMDRLAAIGNGQVPGVVQLAWKLLEV